MKFRLVILTNTVIIIFLYHTKMADLTMTITTM